MNIDLFAITGLENIKRTRSLQSAQNIGRTQGHNVVMILIVLAQALGSVLADSRN